MKHSNMGSGFRKQFILLFFLFGMPGISKNYQIISSSATAATFFNNAGVRTQIHEDALSVVYEDDNMIVNFKIKTISKISINKVKFFGWDDKDGVELNLLTKTTDPKYFNDKTKLYTQYWSAKIYLKPGDNIFTFTSYDKDWYGSKKHMEHESSIKTRNYTYDVLMREQAEFNEFWLDQHMRKEMNESNPGHYVKDCCIGGSEWYELRKQMIQCILHKNPTLAIPQDAKREYAEGSTRMKGLKSANKDDYYIPLSYLNKANKLAPWWGQVYYDLAMAHLAAQNYRLAKENFELYLLFQQSSTQVATALKELHKINLMLEPEKPQPDK